MNTSITLFNLNLHLIVVDKTLSVLLKRFCASEGPNAISLTRKHLKHSRRIGIRQNILIISVFNAGF